MSDDVEQLAVRLPPAVGASPRRSPFTGLAASLRWRGRWTLANPLVRVLLLLPMVATLVDFYVLQQIPVPGGTPHHSTLDFDRWLTHGHGVPTVWLQRHFTFHAHSLAWYDWVAALTYSTHFVVWPVVALVLWWRDPRAFGRFAAAFVPLTFAGYATYVLWPVAPPWLASAEGLMPAVQRLPLAALTSLGVPHSVAAQFDGSSITAAVAGAVPSLHAAYPVLLLLSFWNARTWLRPLLVAYVPLMAVSLVYGGEHFIGDVLIGWTYAIVAWGSVQLVRIAVRRRRDARAAAAVPTGVAS